MQRLLLLLLILLTFSLMGQDVRKVLLIGVDGVRSDALEVASTPNFDDLIATGVYSPDALNDDITISGPGWSAILCGVWSEKHMVVNNSFSGSNYEQYPSIIQRIEAYNPELHTASFCHWTPINDNIVSDFADFKLNFNSDAELASQAAAYVVTNDPDVFFLHFDETDGVGHGSGFSPDNPTYIAAIEAVDQQVGEVLEALRNRANYENEDWLVLVTTDHGGLGTSHGGESFVEQNVFVIASGKNIAPQLIRRDSIYDMTSVVDCLENETSLYFAGDGSQIQVPAHEDFTFGATRDFSVECRVRTMNSADVAIIGNKDWDSGLNPGFVFSFKYPQGPEWKINIGDGINRADLDVGGLIADNEWHTLTATFDRDGLLRMYEDGVLMDVVSISNIGNIDTGEGLFLGSDINQLYPYSGFISEVRIWEGLLDEQDIADWYCQALDESHPSYNQLLAYWPLTQADTGDQILDVSGNMHDGINKGATWQTTDSVLVEDFSTTPRLVDIPVTALQHLCIPIQSGWDLDGVSLIPACSITTLDEIQSGWDIQISPNPLQKGNDLRLVGIDIQEITSLKLYSGDGRMIQNVNRDQLDENGMLKLDLVQSGIYFLHMENNTGQVKSLKFTVL